MYVCVGGVGMMMMMISVLVGKREGGMRPTGLSGDLICLPDVGGYEEC